MRRRWDPPPVDNRAEWTKGDNLPRLVESISTWCCYEWRVLDFLLHYEDKRSNMVWLADDEPRLDALKTGFRPRKRMFTVFFNTRGPVVVDITPDKATITATYYTTSVLPKVLLHNQSTARTRRRSRIQLHHDNAAPHKARITQPDVPWWQWCPFDGTFTIVTRLGVVRFLTLSKIQICPCWETFFKLCKFALFAHFCNG